MIPRPRIVLFTRFPEAGSCKTRLIPALGADGAARLHRRLTERTLDILRSTGQNVTVAITGAPRSSFANWLGDDVMLVQQPDGDLSARLHPFVEAAPVIVFGSDTPDLQPSHVQAAVRGLQNHKVVIGPAEDGGYYLIGMREPLPQLIENMPWSTEQVLPTTLERLEKLGIEPLLLAPLADCDTPEDLERWPDLLNDAPFSVRGRRLVPSPV